MKTFLLVSATILAYAVYVCGLHCEHDDATPCREAITCNNDTMEITCEHNTCTCSLKPETCLQMTDCILTTCKHGENVHCDNQICVCMKAPHGRRAMQ